MPHNEQRNVLIHATDITRSFGRGALITHVLKGISLDVYEGEFVAIMGKSGAGKSTLLYQLSALDVPTSGTITIHDVNIHTQSEHETATFRLYTLGYIFQDYALVPELTARENVILPLLMRGTDWDTALTIAENTLTQVGLIAMDNKLPSELSGGEQQRVAIARAIAGKPKILFADEPTANLDSVSGKAIIELLTQLNHDGQTIVMVTHEAEYTASCHRVIDIEDGRIVHIAENTPAVTPTETTPNIPTEEYVNPVYKALNAH